MNIIKLIGYSALILIIAELSITYFLLNNLNCALSQAMGGVPCQ